ncbi:MAG: lipid-A-disaccharide synthase [Cyclobacteriaceae bacterium]|nr:lipid-A-disaccharide synthase [Cyclobacteriaceae bacterium]
MKYYLIAGEKSGDMHAGNLIRSLAAKDTSARFRGFGGDDMALAGCSITSHYQHFSIMGFVEVLFSLFKIKRYLKLCKQDIDHYKPDVVILVDFAGFNMRIAKYARANGYRVFYYISPKVWAWNTGRALKLKQFVDKMFVILPFEKNFFKSFDWEVDYVGNPVRDAITGFKINPLFAQHPKLSKVTGPKVALLPGSRIQELKHIIPLLERIIARFSDAHFMLAAIDEVPKDLYRTLEQYRNVSIYYGETYDVLNNADAAVVTSGTATLETAFWNVPQVVIYKANPISYAIGKRLIKVKYISLVNLIAGEEVVKELIQNELTEINLSTALNLLLSEKDYRDKIKAGYRKVEELIGPENASRKTAELMVDYLRRYA